MPQIKAAVTRKFGEPLILETVSLRPPEAHEVEVTLGATAICHSDIIFTDGKWGGTLPAIYGHEAAGKITAVGDQVKGYKVGDRVIATLIRACGTCPSCSTGSPVICEDSTEYTSPVSTMDGNSIVQGMNCGAFAERVVVHPSQLAKIPEDMSMDVASLLACGVITGVGAAVNTANIRPGQTVVVIGAGGVGLNAIQGAHIAGAARIIAVDLVPEKLETAKEFGATDTVLASEEAPWDVVKDITNGRMADAVLVSVGVIPVYETAPNYLRSGGKMVMVGMTHSGDKAEYEPVNIAATSQSMIGSKMGDVVLSRDIPWIIDLYKQDRLKLDELISKRWRLEEINEAIEDTRSGAARRNVVIFDETL